MKRKPNVSTTVATKHNATKHSATKHNATKKRFAINQPNRKIAVANATVAWRQIVAAVTAVWRGNRAKSIAARTEYVINYKQRKRKHQRHAQNAVVAHPARKCLSIPSLRVFASVTVWHAVWPPGHSPNTVRTDAVSTWPHFVYSKFCHNAYRSGISRRALPKSRTNGNWTVFGPNRPR